MSNIDWFMVGARIKTNRTLFGLTQARLAEMVNEITGKPINERKIGRWERGEPVQKMDEIKALCSIFHCDTGYILCEYDSRKAESIRIASATGLSADAIDVLNSVNRGEYEHIDSRIISALIEDKDLLTMLCSCAAREYDTVPAAGYEPYETQRHDLLMLYDSLCDFIESYRQKHGLDVSIFDYAETVNRRRKKRP